MSAPSPSTTRCAGPSTLTRAPAAKDAGAGQAYRLSRIRAEGWNSAHRAVSTAPDISDSAEIDFINPYPAEPERARWKIGFMNALRS